MSYCQHHGWLGHIQGGHNRFSIDGDYEGPVGLPEKLIAAQKYP